jgi:hypothetical protein
MMIVQADKIKAIDEAMGDNGNTVPPLSMEDLTSLFGFVQKNRDGTITVVPDYDDASK